MLLRGHRQACLPSLPKLPRCKRQRGRDQREWKGAPCLDYCAQGHWSRRTQSARKRTQPFCAPVNERSVKRQLQREGNAIAFASAVSPFYQSGTVEPRQLQCNFSRAHSLLPFRAWCRCRIHCIRVRGVCEYFQCSRTGIISTGTSSLRRELRHRVKQKEGNSTVGTSAGHWRFIP